MYVTNIIVLLLVVPLVAFAKPQTTTELEIIVPTPPPEIRVYAFQQVVDRWGEHEWEHFEELIDRESDWIHTAQNPHSTAYGLGQFLNSTWKTVGCVKTDDKYKQIDCTIKYVAQRYKTPHKAIHFHDRRNWY